MYSYYIIHIKILETKIYRDNTMMQIVDPVEPPRPPERKKEIELWKKDKDEEGKKKKQAINFQKKQREYLNKR